MPARSKVLALPREVRQRLDALLVERGFGAYAELADWLADASGTPISKSALHRYGSRLESRIEAVRLATEQAEALVAASPDDGGAVADAVLRMAQEQIFQVLLAGGEDANLKDLSAATRALAESVRAGTVVRAERRTAEAEAAARVDNVVRRAGLSADTAAAIRAAIQGAPE